MIRCTAAWTQHGWGGQDHLIDDRRIEALIGQTFRGPAALKRAATRAADRLGFAAIEYVREDGHRIREGCEPALPGREPLYRDLGPVGEGARS